MTMQSYKVLVRYAWVNLHTVIIHTYLTPLQNVTMSQTHILFTARQLLTKQQLHRKQFENILVALPFTKKVDVAVDGQKKLQT